ncbi:MAG: hypothetical protein MZU91_07320 [Desulfosudis oleivorans]|nr:hypothetical protein [Desulfosudis oleivorans]
MRFLIQKKAERKRVIVLIDEAQNLTQDRAGAAAPAVEPRDQPGKAAPDHPGRPARAGGDARLPRPAADRAAHLAPLPDHAR